VSFSFFLQSQILFHTTHSIFFFRRTRFQLVFSFTSNSMASNFFDFSALEIHFLFPQQTTSKSEICMPFFSVWQRLNLLLGLCQFREGLNLFYWFLRRLNLLSLLARRSNLCFLSVSTMTEFAFLLCATIALAFLVCATIEFALLISTIIEFAFLLCAMIALAFLFV
jgi:hypothetical protein